MLVGLLGSCMSLRMNYSLVLFTFFSPTSFACFLANYLIAGSNIFWLWSCMLFSLLLFRGSGLVAGDAFLWDVPLRLYICTIVIIDLIEKKATVVHVRVLGEIVLDCVEFTCLVAPYHLSLRDQTQD